MRELPEVKFHYNYEREAPPKMSDELITEQTGYRTTKQIVEGMLLAGERLNDYRHSELDNYDEDDDDLEARFAYERDRVEELESIQRTIRYREDLRRRRKDEKQRLEEDNVSSEAKQESNSKTSNEASELLSSPPKEF